MKLVGLSCALVLVLGSSPASAEPAPTTAQLDRAKKAFIEGKRLHDAGKLTDAIEKFKASYALSKNPLLLYNIALTMEELGADNLDLAVVFYRRFLAEAPADAPQRPDVADRIAAITRQLGGQPAEAPPTPPPPEPPAPVAIAEAPRSYGPADFQHQAVEAAPPNAALDLTAAAPPEARFSVVLYFRGTDEPGFASTPMRRRGDELVARIPAARMTGRTIQYYLEVKDAGGTVVTRAGKASSPNVINLDASAPPRSFADVTEGPITPAPPVVLGLTGRDKEDPMSRPTVEPVDHGGGPDAVTLARWGTTGAAVIGLGVGITFYALAANHANALASDATSCGTPPCQRYDDFDRDLQRTGKLDQTIGRVALFGGVAFAAVAGYLWYRELSEPHASSSGHASRPQPPRWAIAPITAPDYTGAAAAVRF